MTYLIRHRIHHGPWIVYLHNGSRSAALAAEQFYLDSMFDPSGSPVTHFQVVANKE